MLNVARWMLSAQCAITIRMKIRLFALVLAFAFPGFAAEPTTKTPGSAEKAKAHDYCRFTGDDVRGKLETSIVTMKNKAGVIVELVGAVHIADKSYYAALNALFKTYDVLLFELVDGQNLKAEFEAEAPAPKKTKTPPKTATPPKATATTKPAEDTTTDDQPARAGKKGDAAFSILHGMMTGLGSYLKLEYQTDGVDYSAENFVHADVSLAEFQRLQAEKGESWGTLFRKAMESSLKRGRNKDQEPKGGQLLLALLGDSSGIKIAMARTLGGVEGQSEDMGLGADSVIVGERNRVALEVFDREVKAGRKKLGIFYGAAHLDDLEKRLISRGYERSGERWLTAWDIKPRADEKK